MAGLLLLAACGPRPPAPTSTPTASEPSASGSAPTPTPLDAVPSPTPAAEAPTATPVAAASEPPLSAAWCTDEDLAVSHGLVEGAAGSRFTTVTLTVEGASDCALANPPAYELRDANGNTIALARTGPIEAIVVSPGTVAASDVQLANWCQEAAQPFGLFLLVEGEAAILVGGGPFPEAGELPNCIGPGDVNFAGGAWALP